MINNCYSLFVNRKFDKILPCDCSAKVEIICRNGEKNFLKKAKYYTVAYQGSNGINNEQKINKVVT